MSGVGITGLIEPLNGGSFPVFEDINGLGGWRSVANIAARNAIPANFRKIGMVVVAQDTSIAWQLQGGILDANWVGIAIFYQTVIDTDGTVYPQQPNLEFRTPDFTVSDDPAVFGTRVRLNGVLLPTVDATNNDDTIQVVGGAWTLVVNKKIHLTAQAAAIAATNIFTVLPGAGLYRISAYLDITTAGTAGSTLATRVNFTPDDGTASFSIVTSALNIGTLHGSSGSVIVEANGAVQITYEVDLVGAIGTGVYSLRLVAEQIG